MEARWSESRFSFWAGKFLQLWPAKIALSSFTIVGQSSALTFTFPWPKDTKDLKGRKFPKEGEKSKGKVIREPGLDGNLAGSVSLSLSFHK